MTPVLEARLSAGYGGTTTVQDVELRLQPGEVLGLAGGSGEGKSTLALALLGLLPWRGGWARGRVLLEGTELLSIPEREARQLRGRRIALVPQSPLSALNPAVSLRKHFEQAWLAHERSLGAPFHARLQQLFGEVQLPATADFLLRRPGAVSVGQAQRAVIALAMLHRPSVLVADEPTSALDALTQVEVLRTFAALNQSERTAILYISHDLLSVLRFCDTLAVLAGGRVVETTAVHQLAEGRRHAATEALLSTLPLPLAHFLEHRNREEDLRSKPRSPDG